MKTNIFHSLSKYNKLYDENYLTETFTFILNYFNENNKDLLVDIINSIFLKGIPHKITIEDNITIETQVSAEEHGRPDIFISTEDLLIIIEVKEESPVDIEQLERYHKFLSNYKAEKKHLILLSKYNCEYEMKIRNHVFWYEIYNYFVERRYNELVIEYLRNQFIEFMEVKQMVPKKVSWEYEKGMESMNNIMLMLQTILDTLKIKIYQKSGGWNWRGYYLENNTNKFIGIYYEEPEQIIYEISLESDKWNSKEYKNKGKYEIKEDKHLFIFLDLKKYHFYSLEKEEQLAVLKEFIEETHNLSDDLIVGS